MLYLKEFPIGRDVSLQTLQKGLYDKLKPKWNNIEIEAYGRAYINADAENKKSIIEAYKKNKDYSGNLLTADKTKFFFFEIAKPEPVDQQQLKQNYNLVFIVDTQLSKPSILHYPDEELHKDVRDVLKQYDYLGFQIVDEDYNVQSIFKGYQFTHINPIDFEPFDGMQRHHIFKFGITQIYNPNDETCI